MNRHWKTYVGLSLAGIALVTGMAILTRVWVLTAIPIGFLFGFFLQKGELCGASAFSEVLVMMDRQKVAGLWESLGAEVVRKRTDVAGDGLDVVALRLTRGNAPAVPAHVHVRHAVAGVGEALAHAGPPPVAPVLADAVRRDDERSLA